MRKIRTGAPLLIALTVSAPALADDIALSAPAAVAIPHNVPDAADTPYPGGFIILDIDASDTARALYRVTETIPVNPTDRTLTLLLPEWLPGNHGPRGPMAELVNLQFSTDGQQIKWRRDPVEVYAFHLDLPAGTRQIVAKFIHTSPLQTAEGRITMTPDMLNLQWEKMSLYPAGHYARQIRVRPSVILPPGWTAATALDGMARIGGPGQNRVGWAETNYEVLVDSPIIAGAFFRKFDLGQQVTLNVVADRPEQLAARPEQIEQHRALVSEARAAFGANHFDRYEFLLALSNQLGTIGLEHHRSSENRAEGDAFSDWPGNEWDRGRLPHEYAHSWSGKFRRPARMWTPDYRQPIQGDMLWAYEGQSQFWGLVLAARAGLQGKAMVLGQLASWAGNFSEQPGRSWRSIEDTGFDPVFAARKPKPYPSLARGEDYYGEGALVWLEADQIIRSGTGGRKGIDDFARAFFGMRDGDWGQLSYELGDIVAALSGVYPYDWGRFLRQRLLIPNQPAPLGGIEQGGYRLVWKEAPNPYDAARMLAAKSLSLAYSLGITLEQDGRVSATQWDSPAFTAGLVTGTKLMAVNGITYTPEGLKAAISANRTEALPISLLVKRAEQLQTIRIDYRGGLRWPWLERAAPGSAPTGLDRLLIPRRPKAGK